MRRLARSRPWRGTAEQRKQKLLALNADLALAYDVTAPRVTFGLADERSDRSCYIPALQTIVLRGRNLTHRQARCTDGCIFHRLVTNRICVPILATSYRAAQPVGPHGAA